MGNNQWFVFGVAVFSILLIGWCLRRLHLFVIWYFQYKEELLPVLVSFKKYIQYCFRWDQRYLWNYFIAQIVLLFYYFTLISLVLYDNFNRGKISLVVPRFVLILFGLGFLLLHSVINQSPGEAWRVLKDGCEETFMMVRSKNFSGSLGCFLKVARSLLNYLLLLLGVILITYLTTF